mgnify:CR=1 FL=1
MTLGCVLALAGLARADFEPIPLTPESFTADVIVEKTAPKPFPDYVTATMDGGTNNNAWVWYEQGFDATRPTTGLPPAGSTFSAYSDPNHSFQMPASYSANNALCVYSALPPGTLTLTTPTPLAAISVLNAGGGGASTINYTIYHQGGGAESGTIDILDWFNTTATTVAHIAAGRVNTDNGQVGNTYSASPRLFYNDIILTDMVNPVTKIEFSSTSGNRAAIFGLSGSPDGMNYAPLAVTGFDRDMVIEAGITPTGFLFTKSTVTMDGGSTNNTGNTFYEQGFNTDAPTTGLPPAGSNISGGSPLHTFTLAPDYTTNNVLYVGNYEFVNGDVPGENTLTLVTPASYTGLSFLNTAGNGPVAINVTVTHQDSSVSYYSFSSLDWFNAATAFFTLNGRFDPSTLALNNVNSGNPRLFINDIELTSSSPVTSIQFTWVSGGRAAILAVAGQTTSGGEFSPIAVTGYNADAIVEAAGTPRLPNPLKTATTVSMDGGTNNTGNTWMEKGYYAAMPNSGLPAPGTIISSITQPDHHYQMPASYTANNCVFVDAVHAEANLTPATPATYSALSFLSATANNNVTNEVVMQYADGTQETNTFVSRDWFNNTPYAYTALGRVQLNTRTINADPGHTTTPNPRLYEAQFALGNTTSPLTNMVLRFLGAINPTTGRMVVLAVSGTAGAVPPIISTISPQNIPTTIEGSNITFTATVTGGTEPIAYRWQVGTNGVWVDLNDGGLFSGTMTTTLTITSIGWTNAGDYRMVATNIAGFGVSPTATIGRVLSGLPDITLPGDPLVAYQPNGGSSPANEAVEHAIDNLTSKYLNFGTGSTPFTGPAGFIVKPLRGGTIVSALRFYTANDAEGRDPANYLLEGSNDDGTTWTTIASGPLALPAGRNAGGLPLDPLTQNLQEVHIPNTAGYTSYRVSFSAVKGSGDALMQIGEVELLGVLDPNAVPTVVTAPVSTTANEGATATFSVTAIGPGTLSYQWYNVTAGDPGTPLAGKTAATLSLPNVTAAMNGNAYRVVVSNPYGSVTSPVPPNPGAQLTVVSGPPVIVTDLAAEEVVYAGRTALLPVIINGTEPFTLQWQKNGGNLSDTARIIGSQSNILAIINSQPADNGNYQLATIQNGQGSAQSAVQALTVQKIPAFTLNGAGWALNGVQGSTPYPATMFNGVLALSESLGSTARSAWYKYPLFIGAFKASFVYQDVGGGGADGAAFVLQNDPRGTTALGGSGGSLGYSGITPSVALQINIYVNNTPGIAFNTNGNTGGYVATGDVNVSSGDPIKVDLTYIGGVVYLTLSNTITAATFSTTLPVGDLSERLGSNLAWVGFTGADGGTVSTQNISEFSYIPLPTMTVQPVGSDVVLAWPATIGGYKVQSANSLTAPVWADAGLTETLVGGQYQATVPAGSGSKYYRLVLTP